MPSSAAIASATSGMRATSALTKTMAVIMGDTLAGRLVDRSEVAALLERHQREAGPVDRVVQREVPGGTGHGAGPLAVDLHQADARGLQPAQDLLGLLGGRRRHRPRGR